MSPTPDTNEAATPKATTPGELLKQARERVGLSVERVAKDLYLDTRVIHAIELDRFQELGAPVYAKGYLRKYAKLVGVTEEGILQGYQQMGGAVVPDPIPAAMGTIPESRKPLPTWVLWAVVCVLVLAGVMTLLNLRSPGTEGTQPGTMISQPLNAPGSPDAASIGADSPLNSLPVNATLSANTLGVEFKFSGDSWVEVIDASNRQVLYELGVAGTVRQVQATPPLRVVLGAADAVSVQVNSKLLTVPQKNINDGVARFVVKPDGLLE